MKGRKFESKESEKTVIGGLLLDNSQFLKIQEKIAPEDFSRDIFGEIFYTIINLYEKRKAFDIPMIIDEMGVDKSCELKNSLESLLLNLANECPSVANLSAHADIIREKSVQRQLVAIATEIAQEASVPQKANIRELLDKAESRVRKIADACDVNICPHHIHLISFLREFAEEVANTELTESYLRECIVEVNKAFVSTLEYVEENTQRE